MFVEVVLKTTITDVMSTQTGLLSLRSLQQSKSLLLMFVMQKTIPFNSLNSIVYTS